jgi:VanZ family protein
MAYGRMATSTVAPGAGAVNAAGSDARLRTMSQRRPTWLIALLWLATAAWAAVIYAGSSIPGSQIPGRFSVLGHLGEYTILGILLAAALRVEARTAAMLIALAICAAYAASDEFHQAFVPMRTPDPLDWTVDVFASSIGIAAVALARLRFARRRQ